MTMAEKQSSSSGSSNASDTEESCMSSVLKMEAKTPTCKADALPPVDGAAASVSSASQNKNTATALGLAEGLEMLLQTQRRDLMLELKKLQHGQRPVTNTESRETLEEFFSGESRDGTERRIPSRPESVLSEVRGLSEQRPVTSILRSNAFRRNLEDVIRGTLVRQDSELQRAIRLRSAGFNVGNSRPTTVPASVDPFQQHIEHLSHSSHTSTSSHPSMGLADVFSPPPPPPVPQMGQPLPFQPQEQQFQSMPSFAPSQWRPQQPQMPQNPYQWQQQQYPHWQQQQYPHWQQQQQQQPWQQPQPWQQRPPWQQQAWQQQQQWQPPVQPQQPWLMQNSPQQPSSGVDMVALFQQAHREDAVAEISTLVQRQLVSSMLNSDFRGTLENTMMARLQQTETDGLRVQNFIQSLPQSHPHRRNDFSHLGIHAPTRTQAEASSSSRPATWAGTELDILRQQMEEMQTMMRLTFELQLDMQRSIRQEVAAALTGQHRQDPSTQNVPAPMPPSRPASEGHCVICLEKSVDAVLYQCGHMCCCLSCGLRLKGMGSHCPMCRAPIRDVIRAYRCQRE